MVRRQLAGLGKDGLIAVIAVLSSLAVLIGTETVVFPTLLEFGVTSGIRLIMIVAALGILVVAGWPRREASTAPLPPVALWAPGWFHAFFVACFFGFGFYRENPWMTMAAIINVLLGIAIHLYPHRIEVRRKDLGLSALKQTVGAQSE